MKLSGLFKPEYIFNPKQIIRSVGRKLKRRGQGRTTVALPWGWPIDVWQNEAIGESMIVLGIFDLAVSEVVWRLSDPGETALDIGANVGILTAVLANKVGPRGRVLSFEAHPRISEELRENVARWVPPIGPASITVHGIALSDSAGMVDFEIPYYFSDNHGVSRILHGPSTEPQKGEIVSVPSARLDSFLVEDERVGVVKMDVEGHEEAVLRGTGAFLTSHSIRDWIFEHHGSGPSAVTELYESSGYSIFQIRKNFLGPQLVPLANAIEWKSWENQSYLATLEPQRAIERMKKRGWQVLHAH